MVCRAMGWRWNTFGIQLLCSVVLIMFLEIQGCWSLNSEGLALLQFRARVDKDPYGVFGNWNPNDYDPCMWLGVCCVDGKVQVLDLRRLSLEGVLAPDLWKLTHLRFLVLYKNRLSGAIPKEIGRLIMLEELDLRDNNLSGTIPAEIGKLHSLKRLLLCNNKFEGNIPLGLGKLNLLSELQLDENLTFAAARISCVNRKLGHCIWKSNLKGLNKADSFVNLIKGTSRGYLNVFPLFKLGKGFLHSSAYGGCRNLPSQNVQDIVYTVRRRLLQQSSNLAAAPASGGPIELPSEQDTALPNTRSSGAFPAVPNGKKGQSYPPSPQQTIGTSNSGGPSSNSLEKPTDQQPPAGGTSRSTWKYIVVISGVLLLIIAASMFLICRKQAVSTIGPWKPGLSGKLQKAFVTGVPKLNRSELETACEDFSNIIDTHQDYTLYKGILSSGVEIAVVSTSVSSINDWDKCSETAYRKKIDTLSRVNHKNFVNLIGYCEEDEPFARMMVFEYAPNGTLFEHLHVTEVDCLDWNARTRIIMGIAYCLQYMHDLKPSVAHTNLTSNSIYLTDDYAAKIAEICFTTNAASKSMISSEDESLHSELPPPTDSETNIYSFGVLLLEIISGKLSHSREHGSLVNWASEYLNDKQSISHMIDPTMKSVKNKEVDIICEVIQDCIQQDAMKRPSMKEIVSKLREVIGVSADAATPRLSPLWWAELEVLSAEPN